MPKVIQLLVQRFMEQVLGHPPRAQESVRLRKNVPLSLNWELDPLVAHAPTDGNTAITWA